MKKSEVKVGNIYSAKVTDKVVPVRIDKENTTGGGWDGTNLQTNRKVRIKSAQKLRGEVKGPKPKDDAPADQPKRARKKLTAAERKELQAKHKADQENARLRDERKASDDGMTASIGGERAMASSEKKPDGKKPKAKAAGKKDKKLSLIDAASQVLAKSKEPMNCKQMVEQVVEEKLWSTNAATPHATLYSAILREVQSKGKEARFVKIDRGMFTIAKGA